MAGHFRYSVWDPFLLVTQILTMECIFYTSLGTWIFLTDIITNTNPSLDQIFQYQDLHTHNAQGITIIGSCVINSFCCAIGLWYFVQRTKLCLDFAATAHFLHLLFCWMYSGAFPSTFSWWLTNIICLGLMCVCGEFLCLRTEMKAIPLTLGSKADV